jgi:plasmid stabilization system protein ParE
MPTHQRLQKRLRARVIDFVAKHLANFPRSGRQLTEHDLWEIWIPKTRLVLWYQIKSDLVVIVSVWHSAQDRTKRSLNEEAAEWGDEAKAK